MDDASPTLLSHIINVIFFSFKGTESQIETILEKFRDKPDNFFELNKISFRMIKLRNSLISYNYKYMHLFCHDNIINYHLKASLILF